MVSAAHARPKGTPRAKRWLVVVGILLAVLILWWRAGDVRDVFGRQYEYEEDLTIDLDGSGSLTVNASLAALSALRGLDVDPLGQSVDRDRIRTLYESGVTRVKSVPRPWRRRGRQFVQINLEFDDVRKLNQAAPLSWSAYQLGQEGGQHVFRQTVTASALKPGALKNVGWDGSEIVAFRLHLPSRILEHNARDLEKDEPTGIRRGNILSWEQHLADRLDSRPVTVQVRMESQSILYRTLFLFIGAFAAAVLTLAGLIWWTIRRGTDPDESNPKLQIPNPNQLESPTPIAMDSNQRSERGSN
jgi:hypothetical protein